MATTEESSVVVKEEIDPLPILPSEDVTEGPSKSCHSCGKLVKNLFKYKLILQSGSSEMSYLCSDDCLFKFKKGSKAMPVVGTPISNGHVELDQKRDIIPIDMEDGPLADKCAFCLRRMSYNQRNSDLYFVGPDRQVLCSASCYNFHWARMGVSTVPPRCTQCRTLIYNPMKPSNTAHLIFITWMSAIFCKRECLKEFIIVRSKCGWCNKPAQTSQTGQTFSKWHGHTWTLFCSRACKNQFSQPVSHKTDPPKIYFKNPKTSSNVNACLMCSSPPPARYCLCVERGNRDIPFINTAKPGSNELGLCSDECLRTFLKKYNLTMFDCPTCRKFCASVKEASKLPRLVTNYTGTKVNINGNNPNLYPDVETVALLNIFCGTKCMITFTTCHPEACGLEKSLCAGCNMAPADQPPFFWNQLPESSVCVCSIRCMAKLANKFQKPAQVPNPNRGITMGESDQGKVPNPAHLQTVASSSSSVQEYLTCELCAKRDIAKMFYIIRLSEGSQRKFCSYDCLHSAEPVLAAAVKVSGLKGPLKLADPAKSSPIHADVPEETTETTTDPIPFNPDQPLSRSKSIAQVSTGVRRGVARVSQSLLWSDHFTTVFLDKEFGQEEASQCVHCGRIFSHKNNNRGSTPNLMRHLQFKHKEEYEALQANIDSLPAPTETCDESVNQSAEPINEHHAMPSTLSYPITSSSQPPAQNKCVKNKNIQCGTVMKNMECQTEESWKVNIPIPIPVPIYFPFPYGKMPVFIPTPTPVTIPVPVPCVLPVHERAAKRFKEHIESLITENASDPLQSDLLKMAEMIGKAVEDTEPPSSPMADPVEAEVSGLEPDLLDIDKFGPPPEEDDDEDNGEGIVIKTNGVALSDLTENVQLPGPQWDTPIQTDLAKASVQALKTSPVGMGEKANGSQQHKKRKKVIIEESEASSSRPGSTDPLQGDIKRPRRSAARNAVNKLREVCGVERESVSEESDSNSMSSKGPLPQDFDDDEYDPMEDNDDQNDTKLARFTSKKIEAHVKRTLAVWKVWIIKENEIRKKDSKTVFKEDIVSMSNIELCEALIHFIRSIRRLDESKYATDEIYAFCLGIEAFLRQNNRDDFVFLDAEFDKFVIAFDDLAQGFRPRTISGVAIQCCMSACDLWAIGELGASSPYVLLQTVIFLCCRYFKLHLLKELLDLTFGKVQRVGGSKKGKGPGNYKRRAAWKLVPQGKAVRDVGEVPEMHENAANPDRCPVKIIDTYLSKCSENQRQKGGSFLVNPEPSFSPDSPIWYSSQALDMAVISRIVNRLRLVQEIQEICTKAENEDDS